MRVVIPTQLDSYTNHEREIDVDLSGGDGDPTLAELIAELDARYPGMGFRIVDEQQRIRRHIAIFVGERMVHSLEVRLARDARIQIVGALSGG